MLIRIDTGYACAGIVTNDGTVVDAAPIFRWMIGKRVEDVRSWRKIREWLIISESDPRTQEQDA